MKKILTIIVILLGIISINAQSVSRYAVNTAGGSVSNDEYSIDYAIGEVFTASYDSDDYIITEGFIQPEVTTIVDAINVLEDNDNIVIYPNPVIENINLKLKGFEGKTINVRLIDITGKLRLDDEYKIKNETEEIQIDAKDLSQGIYFVNILMEDEILKRTKIYKK